MRFTLESLQAIPQEIRERIRFLVETASANGSTISLNELRLLMPENRFSTDNVLKDFLDVDERLSGLLTETQGEITVRGREDLVEARKSQRRLARARIVQADEFLHTLSRICPWIELAGISGSTAYAGSKPEDDIDFFLVAKKRRVWISLLLAMVIARLERLRSSNPPMYCFNRIVERSNCERTFRESREPLLAREVLNLVVLRGSRLYGRLLTSAPWIESMFPRLFAARLGEAGSTDDEPRDKAHSVGTIANAVAFLVLGPYLLLAGMVRHVRLRKSRRGRECYNTLIQPARYATASILYNDPRSDYRGVADGPMGWTNVTRFPMPPALAGAMMAYDPRSSVFILFGGSDGEPTNGTWAFDSATGAWAQLHPEVSPMARVDAMLVYDTSADAFVLFGGWTETPDGIYHRLADTWVFFTTNSTWVRRDPLSSPSPRSDVAAAYDEANGVTVLFGGFNGTNYLGDMWYYSYTNDRWIPRSGSRMPSARADGRMVYDVQHETFFLFSGNDHSDLLANFHHLGDMWRYSWINNAWTQIFPDVLPVPRTYAVFAADSAHGELLLTGGYGNRSVLGDTWAFNTTNLVWRNITTMDGPTPRMAAVGDYDPRHELLVLLGGGGRYEIRADTWFFRYPPPIQGSIFVSSPEPVTGEPVQFHSESHGGSGSYVRFSWDFGDGH